MMRVLLKVKQQNSMENGRLGNNGDCKRPVVLPRSPAFGQELEKDFDFLTN